jgi:autotransporter family porin
MNQIYRSIWSILYQTWIAVSQHIHFCKRTARLSTAIVLSSMLFNNETVAGTQNITLPGDGIDYMLQEVTEVNGISGTNNHINGTDGKAAYIFQTNIGSTAESNLISVNKGISIKGGDGGEGNFDRNSSNVGTGGNGGEGINGDRLKINNSGDINGGDGGAGGFSRDYKYGKQGRNGAIAIHGNHLVIDNNKSGYIAGGNGGAHGGYGATAILGDYLIINNKGSIDGGAGAYGGYGIEYINGGNGGSAINGNNLKIYNDFSIWGGYGQYGGYLLNNQTSTPIVGKGGNGGIAILGNNLTIINNTQGNIRGGNGGRGGLAGMGNGGNGGDAINGDNVTINNSGSIYGGNGNEGAISNGGNAVSGGNLTITNSGKIIKGKKGTSSNDGNLSKNGVAIYFSSGKNSLTIQTGSDIQGDIVLAASSDNTLHITSEVKTTINGNLKVNNNSSVILSGKQVSFAENADFGNQTTLTFAEGARLHADKIIFDNTKINTNVTDWDQKDITLANTDNGIIGNYKHISNNLLTTGAKDYAGAILKNQKKTLAYGLKWNDIGGDSHGTFDLKQGNTLNLRVNLTNNSSDNNNKWDGKSLTKDGLGTLQLSAKNDYTGTTNINKGTLKLNIDDAIAHTSELNIAKGDVPNLGGTLNLGGKNQKISKINNNGTILINDLDATIALINKVRVQGDMRNGGILILNNCKNCAGQTYVQEGNWVGEGGTVQFGAILGDDYSKIDQLKITGTATGSTKVRVINQGGHGAKTVEGIELITTGRSDKDAFVQDGRIVAGSYEYHLQRGKTSGNNMNSWYLTSKLNTDKEIRISRPEAGSYVSNLAASNTVFNMRLQDRQGSDWYADPISGESKYNNIWSRVVRGHNKNTLSDKQLKTTADYKVFQIGGDILTSAFSDQDQLYIGLTSGYAKQNSNTRNHLSRYSSYGKVEGYSVGLYGTWYQDTQQRTGAYVDSWIMYNWFHNTVQGEQLAQEKYHSHGITASLETGYEYNAASYPATKGIQSDVYIRPQVQIKWLDVKANDHSEHNGTHVYGKGKGNIQTNLGMRLSVDRHYTNKESTHRIEPFAEVNWLHNTKQYGVNMTDATTNIQGTNNMAEIKLGFEGHIKDNLRLWSNVSQQIGKYNQRHTQCMAGIKYMF